MSKNKPLLDGPRKPNEVLEYEWTGKPQPSWYDGEQKIKRWLSLGGIKMRLRDHRWYPPKKGK